MSKRLPTSLHVLHGTYRRDRHGPRPKPGPRGAMPRAPKWLAGTGRRVWKSIAAELHEGGVLHESNAALLAVYCQSVATVEEASRHLAVEGRFIAQADGRRVANPWGKIADDAAARMVKLAGEFGLTPISRDKLGLGADDERDEFDEFLGGRRTG